MSERQKLMQKIATYDFAVVELNLYLDTHPQDRTALKKLSDYETMSRELREEYEEKYGPIIFRDSPENRMKWIKNPWPWDLCEEAE
ncbi:MAG: spore coat protein CotJB [Acutalibacteraceae bacterium]|nr:spore coat protein CotJB [Clostridia bacterium]MEE3450813.1 spore coat protein CotJB [Acutalibacteraceae bacterium]